MLQIKDISKQYKTGDLVQTALDGVSLNLRDNEFVSILGPSGSGKTTLLNVIGGLDRYDSGDLIINGISTKKYTDRDWDSYRNHTIGFIFQSYNLIPHQTVLANVELALTISGISPSERRKRAKKALEDVGLGNQLHKKPNQMSGGQMQRVAIARALVNNPDILLADEPTGALDSDTSVQVMELLKEVSKDRLVVMVTHNPELAEEYSNRIVRLRDGKITDDSNPYEVEPDAQDEPQHKNMGHSSMSVFTALSLSFNNLWTKKARTLLTSFAGSIGIIGIALIMSLSSGFQKYIDKIQEDTLSTYPLTIQSETADMASAMAAFGTVIAQSQNVPEETVREQQMISQMFAQIGSNDLGAFKKHLDSNMDEIGDTINALKYSYYLTPQIYSPDTSEKITQVNPSTLFGDLTGNSMMSSYMDSNVFHEMIDNVDLLNSQYDILRGRWPESYNEMVMVLSDPNTISDYTSYTLGMRDTAELDEMMDKVMAGEEVEVVGEPMEWSYDDIMSLSFKLVAPSDIYRYNSEYNAWEDMSGDNEYMSELIKNSEDLTIVGIVCAKEGVSASALSPGIAYTSELTYHMIDTASDSKIVKDQLADMDTDVFSGKSFETLGEESSGLDFQNMISVDSGMLSSAFGINLGEDFINEKMKEYIADLSDSVSNNTEPAQKDFMATFNKLAAGMLNDYIKANADPATGIAKLRLTDADAIVSAYLSGKEATAALTALENKYNVPSGTLSQVFRPLLMGLISNYVATAMPSEPVEPDIPETPEDPEVPVDPETPDEPSTSDTDVIPSIPDELPPVDTDDFTSIVDPDSFAAPITSADVSAAVSEYSSSTVVTGASAAMAVSMTEATLQKAIAAKMGEISQDLVASIASSFNVDAGKIASAFSFNLDEEEMTRLMNAFSTSGVERSADSNLRNLGYADIENPSSISIYLVDFTAKEKFLAFLDGYNEDMEKAGKDDLIINYTDMTGVLMSSVKTIVDSVSYVLIAFVAVSLVVSSIMIGIITYISVLERTKEIGVLRAIGASKNNISLVFNAETFIIGLCSGLIGVGVTLLLIPVINSIIHALVGSGDINAYLPVINAVVLIVLSMLLTIVGGLIPSKKAAKKDPVVALRSE